ncbi:hypothetical protein ACTZWW_15090 [Salinarimonas sp. NSM]|uniref:hypothetical protein n=1 Tax=Salinarimonas sp. NSM TaxID=3458003 RepID=UPI0040361EFE
MDDKRPTFIELFLRETADAYKEKGLSTLIPWVIMLCLAAAAAAAYHVPAMFWTNPSIGIPFLVGLLTLNGLIFAFAWSVFAKIFENICAPRFSSYLQQNDLLQKYLFHVGYMHVAQIVAVALTGIALILILFPQIDVMINRVVFALSVGSSIYAIKEATGSVTILYDLIWYRSIFESEMNSNVTRLPGGR